MNQKWVLIFVFILQKSFCSQPASILLTPTVSSFNLTSEGSSFNFTIASFELNSGNENFSDGFDPSYKALAKNSDNGFGIELGVSSDFTVFAFGDSPNECTENSLSFEYYVKEQETEITSNIALLSITCISQSSGSGVSSSLSLTAWLVMLAIGASGLLFVYVVLKAIKRFKHTQKEQSDFNLHGQDLHPINMDSEFQSSSNRDDKQNEIYNYNSNLVKRRRKNRGAGKGSHLKLENEENVLNEMSGAVDPEKSLAFDKPEIIREEASNLSQNDDSEKIHSREFGELSQIKNTVEINPNLSLSYSIVHELSHHQDKPILSEIKEERKNEDN